MLLLSVLLLLGLSATVRAAAVKTGSAYTGVTVSIHKEIPENPSLIQDIKHQFTAASKVLYDATGGWAYYKEIVISVPSLWKASNYPEKIYNDPYEKAEFRIERPNGQYGDQPYTLQPGGCGEPGDYVHLTPDFLADKMHATTETFGPPERLIIHEWSHLRYGIFDEYGIPGDRKFPLFYFSDGFMMLSACSESIKGYHESTNGPICTIYEDYVTQDCYFVPDMSDTETRTSIMALPFMPSIDRFCTSGNQNLTAHNWRAPTKQNVLCNRRSAWDVVSKHADFASQRNSGEAFSPPNFKVVRVEKVPPRYVFVLDVSQSMTGAPLELMKRSANWFVKDLVPDGSFVGVVSFSSSATVIHPITLIDSQGPRGVIQGKIQSMAAGGGTSVGSGLVAAIQALGAAGQPTEDAVLVVITDGEEQTKPFIGEKMQEVIQSKVKTLAIAFGSKASKDLEPLALASGGKSVLIANIQGTSTADLDQVFVEVTTTQTSVDVQIIQLLNKPFELNKEVTETTVTLDQELGKNAIFTLTGQVGNVDMELVTPSGKKYTGSDSVAGKDAARIQFKLPTAESGVWKVVLRKKAGATASVDFSVISEPKNPAEHPVKARAWISGSKVIYGNTNIKVYAQLTKGSDVVIRAKVQGLVVSDLQRKIDITLKDDGAGADTVADDGIYTAYFTNFKAGEKRYTVTAQVENRGSAFIKSSKYSGAPILARRKPRVTPNGPATQRFKLEQFQVLDEDPDAGLPVGDLAADFERTTTGGSFMLENFVEKDLIKPSAITDLTVQATGETLLRKKFIIFTWTAPGDNLDFGTPERLEIRISLEGDRFVKDFSTGFLIQAADILNGSLTPQSGGTEQTLSIYLPKELLDKVPTKKPLDLYLSAKATDKAGNVGDPGNIAVAHFGYQIPICLQNNGVFPKARACGQFYHCFKGKPSLRNCPAGLHFNPQSMLCEWPCSANCDPRIDC